MRKIIDFHGHLGDLTHIRKNVVWDQNIQHGDYPNPFMNLEKSGFAEPLIGDSFEEFKVLLNASDNLCRENTLQNLTKKLDESNITYICILPVLPNTTFEETLATSKLEPRILPFTAADYSLPIEEMVDKLKLDIRNGARGMKIHPVMQNIKLNDPRVHASVETMASFKLPIITHCGANDYYLPDAPYPRDPEAGDVKYFIELAQEYPDITLVAGHAGGLMGGEMEILAEETQGLNNVYVDTTFRSAADILKAVALFGRDKVVLGTDNPFSTHPGAIAQVDKACVNDPQLADLILYENAARLLHIN